MAYYKSDRSFTNFVHKKLAHPIIYKQLGWKKVMIDPAKLAALDMNEGVDYIFKDKNDKRIKLQERFRDNYYKKYNDCTLRYRRDHNPDLSRHKSEFYKVKADFLVYGITNGSKFPDKRHTLTNFIKFVVVDLKVLFNKIEKKLIIPEYGGNFSRIINGKMMAVIKDNTDKSSSFVAFDVRQLQQLFGDENIILLQKGYF